MGGDGDDGGGGGGGGNHGGAVLGRLARGGDFPRVVRVPAHPRGGVSIHLCAADTRRLAPDPSREIVIWLTLVDLHAYNPVNAAEGGLLTPRHEPIDTRPMYVVPGEIACPPSAEVRGLPLERGICR